MGWGHQEELEGVVVDEYDQNTLHAYTINSKEK